MRYKILAGPKAGQVEDFKPGPYLDNLKKAGIVEPLPDPAPVPPAYRTPQTTWKLCRSLDPSNELYVHVSCATCGEWWAIGRPTDKYRFIHCGVPGNPVREAIPLHIMDEGRRIWDQDAKMRTDFKHHMAAVAGSEQSEFALLRAQGKRS